MPIITSGIFLPNGLFLPNYGDGHAKNAGRFCEKYENLESEKNKSVLNADEFLISAGCAIVASYSGTRYFKVAEDNPNPIIKGLTEIYEQAGYKIWPYWKIDEEAYNVMNQIIMCMPKMVLITRRSSAFE